MACPAHKQKALALANVAAVVGVAVKRNLVVEKQGDILNFFIGELLLNPVALGCAGGVNDVHLRHNPHLNFFPPLRLGACSNTTFHLELTLGAHEVQVVALVKALSLGGKLLHHRQVSIGHIGTMNVHGIKCMAMLLQPVAVPRPVLVAV